MDGSKLHENSAVIPSTGGLILAPHNSLMSKDNLGKTDCLITAGSRMLVPCVCLMINSKAFKQNKRIAVKINLEGPRPEVHKV